MQQVARSITRNSALTIVAQLAIKLISFAFTIMIVRSLGADSYGQYTAIAAFGTMFLFIGDLGLSPYLVREVARLRGTPDSDARIGDLYATVTSLRLALSLAAVSLMLVVAWLSGRPLVMIGALAINSAGMVLYAIQGSSETILAGHERLDMIAGSKITFQISFVILGASALLLGTGYYGLTVASVIAISIFTIICRRAVMRLGVRLGRVARASWPGLVRASLPFGVVAFALGLSYKFDSVLLSVFRSDAETGHYNAAYGLVFSMLFVSNAINTALYPSLTRQATIDPDSVPAVYGRIMRYLLLIGLPLAVGGSFLADRIVPFLFGPGYEPATDVLRVVIWVVPLMFLSEFLGYVVIIGGQERSVARSVLVSTGVNVTLNLVLVPRFGLAAAAIMTVATEAVLVAQYLWLLRADMARADWGQTLARPALAALLMGGLVLLLPSLPLLGTVATGAAAYGVALLGLGVLGADEWRFIRGLRRPIPSPDGGPA